MKNLQRGLFLIDAAVMRALEPLGMTMYIYIYIYGYTSLAFQSSVKQIYVNYLLKAYVAPILVSSDYMAYENLIPTFSLL